MLLRPQGAWEVRACSFRAITNLLISFINITIILFLLIISFGISIHTIILAMAIILLIILVVIMTELSGHPKTGRCLRGSGGMNIGSIIGVHMKFS